MIKRNSRGAGDAEPAHSGSAQRQRAEEIFRERAAKSPVRLDALSAEETQLMLHELRVHQIELEMQNEELRRAQLELEAVRASYFDLYDLAPVGYCSVSEPGLVLQANLTAANLLGVVRGALVRQPLSRFILKDDQDVYYLMRKQLLATGAPQACELRMLKTDATPIWVHLAATVVRDAEGAPVLRVVLGDITERKQAEAAHNMLEARMHESQKMEALGTLAGGVAHDFNNALAMIIGNVELARQDVGPDHAALVSLEEIGKASRRAKNLVQQILTFSRHQKIERKATPLAPVVRESARLLRAGLPAKVSLKVDCGSDTPAVLADAMQISQILLNLCGNALHAVLAQERAGAIEIRLHAHTQREARDDLRPGRYACLTVRDNGAGMDAATRTRIFEPFFTTKQVGEGTGLGLAVVYSVVQAHEATIEVESTPGQGSAFHIYFPAVEAHVAADAAATAAAVPVDGKGKHILYVDDEEAIILLMQRLLERQGYRVSAYVDPLEALAAARADAGQFDLVVTDYNMPHMSGLQLAQALREIRADLPVVLTSGYLTDELRAAAPAAGIRELIFKPDTADELCAAVARCANVQSGNARSS
ncbi:MAG: response regulator [Burkholderiales bacterium]|nr:response regulator [Burkholderiales bacterium]